MQQYIIRRSLLNIFVLFLVATMVFGALRIDPGTIIRNRSASCVADVVNSDPDTCRKIAKSELGLNASIPQQYWDFMKDLVPFVNGQGSPDLGESFYTKHSVLDDIKTRALPSVELGLLQLVVALAIALPVGVISAIRQDTWMDYILRFFAIFFLGIPVFIIAIAVITLTTKFADGTIIEDWLGPHNTGWVEIWENPYQNLKLVSGAALVGGLGTGAVIMRFLRSQMLEVMRQDYVRTAWAKGLRERVVIIRHALKNALIPVLTVVGLLLGTIISGNVILENIYNIQGIGFYVTFSAAQFDFPVMQGIVLVVAMLLVFVNLLVDVAYGWLDPRIRYS